MLTRDRQIRMQMHQLLDACVFAFSFWFAYVLRADPNLMDLLHLNPPNPFRDYVWLYLVLIPAAPLVLEAQGYYSRPLQCRRRVTAWILARASLIIVLGLILVGFFFQVVTARAFIVWFGFVSFGVMLLKDEVLRLRLQRKLARANYRRRFILVGTPEETQRLRRELREQREIDVVAELSINDTPLETLVCRVHDYSVNGVLIGTKHTFFERVEAVIRACELEGVEAWVAADFFKTQISRASFDDFYGHPVLVFRTAPESSWQSVFKQLLDHVGALIALMIVAFPMFIIGLLVKLTSPGPVFFKQQRSGLNGRPFTIYKFRTMVTNAEQLKHELASMNEMSGPVFKISKDPRITPIGKLLRKFSLDELPQLFNVMRGEMSLVGPRPLPVDEVKRFNDLAHRRRLSVKPGLTCLWQISGRNNVSDFRDWVRLDLEYIDNWSFWLDLKILWRTVPVVLAGTGAK
jgi:exopolysaccharide biosynthesis polyprenyl glycosylphosphotransferase